MVLAEESSWPIVLSKDGSKLSLGTISVNLEPLGIIRVGQGHIFSNGGLDVIESLLMYLIPMPRFFLTLSLLVVLV